MLEQLRSELIQEAHNAPKLFRDMAKLEKYIAESYKTRALIELIQNADDAESTIFGIHDFHDGFVVGNNGRPFTIEDVEALCRSGSSHKYRGGTTIGYRGIGFKSVINLAQRIYVISGDFSFYFDKRKTQEVLRTDLDVPLVRVPHPLHNQGPRFMNRVLKLRDDRCYQTVFVFDALDERLSAEELSDFDRSSLLFLNHLRNVCLNFRDIQRDINVEPRHRGKEHAVIVTEQGESDEWEVLISERDSINRVALKRSREEIVPASAGESVFHSFTPTLEFAGAYIKINGDYSTDPSRKHIDMDELSQGSFSAATTIIANTIVAILDGETEKRGFFTPFINVRAQAQSRFKSLLFESIRESLEQRKLKTIQGGYTSLLQMRLRPDWLNYEDYEKLCLGETAPIGKDLLLLYPGLPAFLGALHINKLDLDDILKHFNAASVSVIGCAQIFGKIINQYRYDLDADRLTAIASLRIFPVSGALIMAKEVRSTSELEIQFLDYLRDHADWPDIRMFLKKLDIEIVEDQSGRAPDRPDATEKKHPGTPKGFKAPPVTKRWRSAERNAAEYLKALHGVLNVADVSQANLGYDLEILFDTGKKVYVEVKMVGSFSRPFKLTNNEYSSAHTYGVDYFVALVIEGETFDIRLVPDPVNTLSLEKKCERWSWQCVEYTNALREVTQLLSVE